MTVDSENTASVAGGTSSAGPSDDADLDRMLLIRHFESALLELFSAGKLNGTTHTCLGQEYIPVALEPLLRGDFIFSNHRGHGHCLARFDDPEGLLAEIMGRKGAVCHGVGGSQHIHRDRFLTTGVQGESMPVAVGVALHYRHTRERRIAVVFTGDGTWGEGALYEALNMAKLWDLPLLVVVEHNGIAQSTPTTLQMAGTIGDRARAFGLRFQEIGHNDVGRIRSEVAGTVAAVRDAHEPAVVQFNTARLGPHSKGDDTRSPEEVERLRAGDWYAALEAAFPAAFRAADERQRRRVAEVVREVESRPLSEWPDMKVIT